MAEFPSKLAERNKGKEHEQELNTVWQRFFEMIRLPYPKNDASNIIKYFEKYALSNRFGFEVDKRQNVCISIAPSLGRENDKEVVIQGHHDAIYAPTDLSSTGEITPVVTEDGQWIKGDGTSLTCDNRNGLAIGLTAVETISKNGIPHGPMKIVITSGEDSGLIGANYLGKTKSSFLNGKQVLINIDSSEGPEWVTIGSASGSRDRLIIPITKEEIKNKKLIKFVFQGFPGGHSGLDIGKNRPSSIKFFAELFDALKKEFPDVGLASITAGTAFNAIPQTASFILAADAQDEKRINEFFSQYVKTIKKNIPADVDQDYLDSRKNILIDQQNLSGNEQEITQQLTPDSSDQLIDLLLKLPHGVGEKSEEKILSSFNIGVVNMGKDKIIIDTMTRGKETPYRDRLRDGIRKIASSFNISIEELLVYPHWSPQPDRTIVRLIQEIGLQLFEKEIKTRVSQGGLEPGIFKRDFELDESVSLGAWIQNEHTDHDQVNIDSVEQIYLLLSTVLIKVFDAYRN